MRYFAGKFNIFRNGAKFGCFLHRSKIISIGWIISCTMLNKERKITACTHFVRGCGHRCCFLQLFHPGIVQNTDMFLCALLWLHQSHNWSSRQHAEYFGSLYKTYIRSWSRRWVFEFLMYTLLSLFGPHTQGEMVRCLFAVMWIPLEHIFRIKLI